MFEQIIIIFKYFSHTLERFIVFLVTRVKSELDLPIILFTILAIHEGTNRASEREMHKHKMMSIEAAWHLPHGLLRGVRFNVPVINNPLTGSNMASWQSILPAPNSSLTSLFLDKHFFCNWRIYSLFNKTP